MARHFVGIELFRGIDGPEGRIFREKLQRTDKGKQLREEPLTGYSSKSQIGERFGVNAGGITIRRQVKRADVLFPPEIVNARSWLKGDEEEFIVKHPAPRVIRRRDIRTERQNS
jgi:hypothetical protein